MPSFLVVASALACGHTVGSDEGDEHGNGGSGGSGGNNVAGTWIGGPNPPCPSLPGGSCPPQQSCPASEPAENGFCEGSLVCHYGNPTPCGGVGVVASCINGSWQKQGQVSSGICNPPPPTCPLDRPLAGSVCSLAFSPPTTGPCVYPDLTCGVVTAYCAGTAWQIDSCGAGGAPGQAGTPGYGGAPDFAGAPGYAGSPDFGGAPGHAGSPDFGGASDQGS